jgi:hypothetical protein
VNSVRIEPKGSGPLQLQIRPLLPRMGLVTSLQRRNSPFAEPQTSDLRSSLHSFIHQLQHGEHTLDWLLNRCIYAEVRAHSTSLVMANLLSCCPLSSEVWSLICAQTDDFTLWIVYRQVSKVMRAEAEREFARTRLPQLRIKFSCCGRIADFGSGVLSHTGDLEHEQQFRSPRHSCDRQS